jgi:hypothetical protein
MPDQSKLPPLRILNALMDDSYRERVIRQTLKYVKNNKSKSNHLDNALLQVVMVRGFSKHPTRAPMSQILPEAIKGFQRSDTVVAAILALWVENNHKLYTQLNQHLELEGVELIRANDLTKSFRGFHSSQEMSDHLESFQIKFADLDKDDIHLMYLCVRGTLPLSPEDEKQEKKEIMSQKEDDRDGYIWEGWLEQFQTLASDAPEWDKIGDFVKAVTELAEEKQQNRQNVVRLQTSLVRLCAEFADQIEFFEFAGCDDWQADHCSLEQIPEAAEKLDALQNILVEYVNLDHQEPRNFKERSACSERLNKLGMQATEIYVQLQRIFETTIPEDGVSKENEESPVTGEDDAEDEKEDDRPEIEMVTLEDAERDIESIAEQIDPEHEENNAPKVSLVADELEKMADNEPEMKPGEPENRVIQEDETKLDPAEDGQISEPTLEIRSKDAENDDIEIIEGTIPKIDNEALKERTIISDKPKLSTSSKKNKTFPVIEPVSSALLDPTELLNKTQTTLEEWLGLWGDLPKAYLLITWLRNNHQSLAKNYPSPELCEFAYYAFQPIDDESLKKEWPSLDTLSKTMNSTSEELPIATWHIVAALTVLHGETTVDELLDHRYGWSDEFTAWSEMAEAIHTYWQNTLEPLSLVKRHLKKQKKQSNQNKLHLKMQKDAQNTLLLIEKPGKIQRLRNHVAQELSWLKEGLRLDTPNQDVLDWARRFDPAKQIRDAGVAIELKQIEPGQPEFRQLDRNLQNLRKYILRWGELSSKTQNEETQQVISHYRQLKKTITKRGKSWRSEWFDVLTEHPTLVNWSNLLLQRLETSIAEAEG